MNAKLITLIFILKFELYIQLASDQIQFIF